ncbi:MAG: adenosine kinase [Candidatus Azobacteroides sp.]|nr:adenosine kinase [Candidatus Azobacteroides sp.]
MKILGIGNALVDVLVKLPDEKLLSELDIAKGSMNLIDAEKREMIFEKIKNFTITQTTGGSVSNTTLALKQLGEPVGFMGKAGNDLYGDFYLKEMTQREIELHLIQEEALSGTAIALIAPDGERTFCTYLGAAADMRKTDLHPSILEQYTHFYIEGYLVQNHELIETALEMAKSLGMTTIFDLASYNVVASDKEFIQSLVDRYVDILFANEEEAKALTGKSSDQALLEIAKKTPMVVMKGGAKGSWVKQKDLFIHAPVYKEIHPLDTTAAGDYYAAGFFYGMINQANAEKCAQLGTLLSYHIIQVIGTKLPEETWNEIREKAKAILAEEC